MLTPALIPHILAHSLPNQSQLLSYLASSEVFFAAALLIIGILLMLFGFMAYRWIVVFNCVVLGFWLGGLLGQRAQVATVAAVIGALVLGAISWPLMKYAVAVCGGLVGAAVGMAIWIYCGQPADMAWAGGLVGVAVLGLLSFILFKTSVILFTCVQGAAMFVIGTAAILMKYTPWSSDVGDSLSRKPVLFPLLVVSVAILALLWQHQQYGLIGNDGAPAGGGKSKSAADSESKKK